MKKTMQFLFAMSIMLEGSASFAGINPATAIVDKPVLNTPMVSPIRGQQLLLITVLDEHSKPIAGALVAAPCTGQGDQYTNSSGVAEWTLSGSCGCTGTQARVQTSTCDEEITLHCGVNNQAICN